MEGRECNSPAQQLVHASPKTEYNWEILKMQDSESNKTLSMTLDVTVYNRSFWVELCVFQIDSARYNPTFYETRIIHV